MVATSPQTTEGHVRAAIAQLIEEDSQLAQHEGRQESRYPFFQPVTICSEHSPVPVAGITRQISPSGIGLLHCSPVEPGQATVSMGSSQGHAVSLPIEITWCFSCGPHWHLSGGRLLSADKDFQTSVVTTSVPTQLRHNSDLLSEIIGSIGQVIAAAAERLGSADDYANRRNEERYYATLPVSAVLETPPDIVDRIRMVTRDLSRNGIALISDRKISADLLTLEISDRRGENTLVALMEVLRCQPIGHLYEIAGRFVTKVYQE